MYGSQENPIHTIYSGKPLQTSDPWHMHYLGKYNGWLPGRREYGFPGDAFYKTCFMFNEKILNPDMRCLLVLQERSHFCPNLKKAYKHINIIELFSFRQFFA